MLFVVLAAAIAGAAYRYYVAQRESLETEVCSHLQAVAVFEASEMATWREWRMEQANLFLASPFLADAVRRAAAGNGLPELRRKTAELCERLGYANAILTDSHGKVVLSAGQVFGDAAHIRQISEEVMRTNAVVYRDLHLEEPGGAILLGLNIPLRGTGDVPVGALLLGIDPTSRLYPMLRQFPAPSRSAETVLVRREGDELVYLNDLRYRKDAALRLRIPITRQEIPAIQVLHGVRGIVRGVDYRGVPVFAAVSPVPGWPWYLAAKVDISEAMAPQRRRGILLASSAALLILLCGAVLFIVWRRQQMQFYRARYEADVERRALAGHYDYLTRFANDIILLIDSTGRIVEANDRAVTAYGYSAEELQRMNIRDLRAPAGAAAFEQQWREAGERGSLVFEATHQARDGHTFPVEVSVRSMDVGGVAYRQSIIRDITERKMMDERLRRMLDAFGAVIDSSPAAIISLTPDLVVTTWNKTAERMFGWTAPETVGKVVPCIPADRMESAQQMRATVMSGREFLRLRTRAQCKDGRILTVNVSAAPLHDPDGGSAGIALNLLDITSQTEAEEGLRRNEFLYRATFEQAAVGMNYVSLDGRFLRVNRRFCEITGYSQEELLQLRFQDITHTDDLPLSAEYTELLMDQGSTTTTQTKRYIRKDGTVVWAQVTSSLLRDEAGAPLHFVGVVDDVTERLRTEEALRHSEERFRRVVESAPEGILVERDLKILYVNTKAVAMFGASTSREIEGRDVLELIGPEHRAAVMERSSQSWQNPVPPAERTYLKVDGTPFPVEVFASPIQYDGDAASLVFMRDIAERKQTEAEKRRLEEQLLQAQKMESLGRLAGGVAHDFNNHLTVITGYCDMLLAQLDEGQSTREDIEEIRAAGAKAASLTQQLLAFSRKQIAERKPVNLNDVVAESHKMLRRLIGEQIEIVTILDPELHLVVADRGQMNQVLMNLSINARDAMPSGGRIELRTANVQLDAGSVRADNAAPGLYVLLSVSDNGSGMSPATLQHVFEPFYTTKGAGIGTGLGLSTVYGIVRQSGGWIEVDSSPGQGSQFRVYLPRVADSVLPVHADVPLAPGPGGAETVMVVEDQPEVRRLALRILKSNGYHLLEAASGPEALQLSRQYQGTIDLLVTDVIMPGMTGRETAAQMLQSRPEMKVLYVSGYSGDVIAREGVLDEGVDYLPKPFTSAQLSVKVREVLGQSKSIGRILVVDDEESVRNLLQQVLRDAGYDVQAAPDGRAAIEAVAREHVDLVITDLIMPDQEGIETIRELQQNYPAIRIIAMSGAVGGGYLKTAELLGAHVTLQKPVDTQELIRIVRELLS